MCCCESAAVCAGVPTAAAQLREAAGSCERLAPALCLLQGTSSCHQAAGAQRLLASRCCAVERCESWAVDSSEQHSSMICTAGLGLCLAACELQLADAAIRYAGALAGQTPAQALLGSAPCQAAACSCGLHPGSLAQTCGRAEIHQAAAQYGHHSGCLVASAGRHKVRASAPAWQLQRRLG